MITPSRIQRPPTRGLEVVKADDGLYTITNAYEGAYEYFAGRPITFDWTEDDLRAQYNIAKQCGWLDQIKAVAEQVGQPAELLLGIASRETGFLWSRNPDGAIRGDGGHGHGLMQIDDRHFPQFCHSPDWHDIEKNVTKGVEILQEKEHSLRKHGIAEDMFPHAAVAAYDCGEEGVLKAFHAGEDVDAHTAFGSYGTDVLARAAKFKAFLSEDA